MYIALTIFLSLFAISFHELGHAWAMLRSGVQVRTISLLGFPIPGLPFFSRKVHVKGQEKPVNIQIHLFAVGAYVMPDIKSLEATDARTKGFIYGAGPFASMVYSLLMYICALATYPMHLSTAVIWWGSVFGILAIMMIFHKIICQYVILAIGIIQVGIILSIILSNPHSAGDMAGGPISMASEAAQNYHAGEIIHQQLRTAFKIAAGFSLAIGLTNMLPFWILDGGRIAQAYLGKFNKRLTTICSVAGAFLLILVVVSACSNDLKVLLNSLSKQY